LSPFEIFRPIITVDPDPILAERHTGLRIFSIDFLCFTKFYTSLIFRAGADVIISYFTPEVLAWLNEDSA
jgi:hypothetical protein